MIPLDHLVAIHPETRVVTARWFGPTHSSDAEAWAAAANGAGSNVYWTVNEVRAGLDRKPSKADIVRVRFAHVDIDPSPGWDEAAKLAEVMAEAPDLVIHSGNGLQALWALTDNPSQEAVEELNRRLAHRLGGDGNCWNVDRLLRVPGTLNYPDAKKRAQGRVVTAAKLLVG